MLSKIKDWFWCVKEFLCNIWLFRKALWNYRAFDYCGMLEFMETSARDMSRSHDQYSCALNKDRTARELLVFAEYMKRIREQDHYLKHLDMIDVKGEGFPFTLMGKPKTLPIYGTKEWDRLDSAVMNHYTEQAAKMFEKKLRSWWN